ncbi:hypothetical protein K6Y31_12265 [Motilimonas cestriensis]|uniref:Flagellar protein FliT n=1 Tax=Motilimonas cestriensis TaxID=2742685 RepID=A0ABS8WE25_9GAMM|nr:hypothetical protein [Motilimonas cestriensis]MCE2595595.1 hypothetical protein [Motilimonas cestriensis]
MANDPNSLLAQIAFFSEQSEQAVEKGMFDDATRLLELRLVEIKSFFQSLPADTSNQHYDFFVALLKSDRKNLKKLELHKQALKAQELNTNKTYKAINKYINIKGL